MKLYASILYNFLFIQCPIVLLNYVHKQKRRTLKLMPLNDLILLLSLLFFCLTTILLKSVNIYFK